MGTPYSLSAATDGNAGAAGVAAEFAVASTAAVGAAVGAAATAAVVIAMAAKAIAHPIRFILTPKVGFAGRPACKRAREIGGLIGAGAPPLKGVEPPRFHA